MFTAVTLKVCFVEVVLERHARLQSVEEPLGERSAALTPCLAPHPAPVFLLLALLVLAGLLLSPATLYGLPLFELQLAFTPPQAIWNNFIRRVIVILVIRL